jgi:hypothetical protein
MEQKQFQAEKILLELSEHIHAIGSKHLYASKHLLQ